MEYHDLTSMEQVEALPIHEFNLRIQCLRERLGIADPLPVETRPITKRSLVEVLLEEQRKRKEAD